MTPYDERLKDLIKRKGQGNSPPLKDIS